MHSDKARDIAMNQPQWETWPSGSPDVHDPLAQEQEVALSSPVEEFVKQIQLPKQLEAVRKATEFPYERHRWNTNEEVAAILIAFDKHELWEKQEVRTRPPSGTMLLYSRKRVRYRKDGYCWKKRKDGKTTREDHMKLKVQGIECIYGSYVHSAILPTFHRRCYWLLQNPDLVLVHYLNVPLTDDSKICIPPILQVDCKDWSHEDLVSQLRPMFASVKHFDMASSMNETTEDAIESLVKHILSTSTNASEAASVHVTTGAGMPQTVIETLKTASESKVIRSSDAGSMHNRLLQLIYSHKMSPGGMSTAVPCVIGQPQITQGQVGLAVCEPNNGTAIIHGLKSDVTSRSSHKLAPHNGPLILNVSPMPGSKGLLILSSQAAASKGTLSVLHQTPTSSGIDLTTSKEKVESNLASDYVGLSKKSFRPLFAGFGLENTRAQSEPAVVSKTPCYSVSDYLSHGDILGEFDLQHVIKTEAKDDLPETSGNVPGFSGSSCTAEFSSAACLSKPSSVGGSETQDLNQLRLESMEFFFGDSGLAEQEQHSLIGEGGNIKCEFYDFNISPNDAESRGVAATEAVVAAGSSCLTDNMDTSLAENQKDVDDIKELHGNDLMMDELEDILHIVSESLGSSVDLTNTYSLPEVGQGSNVAGVSELYQCADLSASNVSGSGQILSGDEKPCLGCAQNKMLSVNDGPQLCQGNGKAGLVEITDYCPEWSYTEGGTKVLVTGPWHQSAASYSVLFDDLSVPTSMVQGGVLRCFAPAHCPAVVCLRVACNGQVISEPKVFEYKSRDQAEKGNETDWFLVQGHQLKESLVQRFVEVEKCVTEDQTPTLSTSLSSEVTESSLVCLVDRLAEQPLPPHCSPPMEFSSCMTLLHLSAALGYSRLIVALIKWRNSCHSLILEQEVDSLSVDSRGNTPLMWACARGHSEAIMVLARWSPSSLHTSNKANWLPATVLEHFGNRSIVELQQTAAASTQRSPLASVDATTELANFWQTLPSQHFDVSKEKKYERVEFLSSEELFFSSSGVVPEKASYPTAERSGKEKKSSLVEADLADEQLSSLQMAPPADLSDLDTCSPVLVGVSNSCSAQKRTRLMKRTSVDILPDYPQFRNDLVKLSRTGAHPGGTDEGRDCFESQTHVVSSGNNATYMTGLRVSSSDPHLTNLVHSSSPGSGGDPMISRIDRDLNSPVLFLQPSISFDEDKGLSLEDLQRETVAMDMGDSPDNLEGLSRDDVSEMLQSASVEADDDMTHSNQMMTLASQIIAAMPDRIKISPSHSKHLLMDEINSRRDRSSSYGSFSSCSSSTPPVCITEDSGISTPLEGMSFLEYRYSDMGTPTSTLSPTSTCMQSPYSFGLDSPPPTTAEFTEYFNAPAMYMEKDFSQLTLSDEEQRRLYEAAKIIQSFYRKYKDKKEQQLRQQQKEIEAAILIQSYYRRYKQFMYYKRMTQAAVLIQSQFRSYYAQKCFKRSREAATIIQNRYRAYKEYERYKKSRNAAVIIQQRFRSHYQRTLAGRQSSLANTVQKMMADSDVSLETTDVQQLGIDDSNPNRNSSEQTSSLSKSDIACWTVSTTAAKKDAIDCPGDTKEVSSTNEDNAQSL